MFKTLLIRFLFKLLAVDAKTKDLVPFDDLKTIAGEDQARKITEEFRRQKYIKSLASAYHNQHFNEWLYLQVVTKRNEHIKTLNKEKRAAQRSAMLTFLMIIEELRRANNDLKKMSKRK